MSTSKQDVAFTQLMEGYAVTEISKQALDSAIDFISSEFEPSDVFSKEQLSEWAENNGYVKE